MVSEGDRVNTNQAMISYYGLNSLELRAQIPSAQVAMVNKAIRNQKLLSAKVNANGDQYDFSLVRLAGNASLSGVDAFFEVPVDVDWLRPGELLDIQLIGEPEDNSFAIPFSAIYGSDRIYKVEQGELIALEMKLLGETLVDGNTMALVSAALSDGDVITVTHLPNAISGLKVSVLDSGLDTGMDSGK